MNSARSVQRGQRVTEPDKRGCSCVRLANKSILSSVCVLKSPVPVPPYSGFSSVLDTLAFSARRCRRAHTYPFLQQYPVYPSVISPSCRLRTDLFQMSRSRLGSVTPAFRRSLLCGIDMSLLPSISGLNSPAPLANSDDLIPVLIQGS